MQIINAVGGLNNGPKVSIARLSLERETAFMPSQVETQKTIGDLTELARVTRLENSRMAITDEHLACQLARLRAEIRSLLATTPLDTSGVMRNISDERCLGLPRQS